MEQTNIPIEPISDESRLRWQHNFRQESVDTRICSSWRGTNGQVDGTRRQSNQSHKRLRSCEAIEGKYRSGKIQAFSEKKEDKSRNFSQSHQAKPSRANSI